MLQDHPASSVAPRAGAGLRFPALVWALLHVPVVLALYAEPLRTAIAATPGRWQPWLLPTFLPQVLVLALLLWLLALPFSRWPRLYVRAAPALAGLATVVLAVDSRVLGSAGFHLNGFFFRVMLQPTALVEAGVKPLDLAVVAAAAVAWLALELAIGARFLRRFASTRRTWVAATAILLLGTAERFYGAALTEWGGPSIFAASGVLPLQVPVRMHRFMANLRGKGTDPIAKARAGTELPEGVAAAEVRFPRKPDVLFVVSESLPADHLDARTMPRLWARAASGGARFTRHYASASATNYTIFSLIYGLQAQKLEATIGAGRRTLLFPALRENGYQLSLLAASCVDWMDLKETAFAGATDALKTWCVEPKAPFRDAAMLDAASAFVTQADPGKPVFMFLFFFGTHFDYFHDAEDAIFTPEWDGQGGLKATAEPGHLIQARARNAAHALDRRLDAFLREFEARRGRAPVVLFTGDHGEEFRQKGHIGHGSDVVREQIHVPFVLLGPGVPAGVYEEPTSHVDLLPTLFSLLGDTHAPSLYSDGIPAWEARPDRFVVSTVGWEPQYAVVGKDLKVKMYAGLGTAQVTDPDDRPLADGDARFAASASRILKALRGEHAPQAPSVRTASGETAGAASSPATGARLAP